MPSLLDLFSSSTPLGQLGPSTGVPSVDRSASPNVAYDIQNPKLKPITIQNVVLQNTVQRPFNYARNTFSDRLTETTLEQEISGIRVLGKLSEGLLYGTQATRITTRTTRTLDMIKSDKGGDAQGLIGGVIGGLRDAGSNLLGIPQGAVPTFVKDSLKGYGDETQNRMVDLARIKKSAEGSIVGKFLKNNASGTPQQIASQALGAVAEGGKKLIRNILFGNPNTYYKVNPTKQGLVTDSVINYGSDTTQINVINPPLFGPLPPGVDRLISPNKEYDAKGHTYSSTFDLKRITSTFSSLDSKLDEGGMISKLAGGKIGLPEVITEYEIAPGISGGVDVYTTNINRMSSKRFMRQSTLQFFAGDGYFDGVNRLSVYSDDDINIAGTEISKLDTDFIPLVFYSPVRKYNVQFRATISGLSETFAPSWDSQKMIGNPFNFYTYSGVERSVTFNFKVYSLNAEEHLIAWEKLQFLTSLVYPQSYDANTSYITPPIIYFTLGSMYQKRASFIESLSYTVDDNTPWEIGVNPSDLNRNPKLFRNEDVNSDGLKGSDIDMTNLRLPRIVDVAVTLKLIESRFITNNYRYYDTSALTYGIYEKPKPQPSTSEPQAPTPPQLSPAISAGRVTTRTLQTPTIGGGLNQAFENGTLERNPLRVGGATLNGI